MAEGNDYYLKKRKASPSFNSSERFKVHEDSIDLLSSSPTDSFTNGFMANSESKPKRPTVFSAAGSRAPTAAAEAKPAKPAAQSTFYGRMSSYLDGPSARQSSSPQVDGPASSSFASVAPVSGSSFTTSSSPAPPSVVSNSMSTAQARFKELTSKFAANGSTGGANRSYSLSGSTSKIDRIKGQAVKRATQTGPSPARPVGASTDPLDAVSANDKEIILRLKEIFPSFPIAALSVAVRINVTFEASAAWLAKKEEYSRQALSRMNENGKPLYASSSSSPVQVISSRTREIVNLSQENPSPSPIVKKKISKSRTKYSDSEEEEEELDLGSDEEEEGPELDSDDLEEVEEEEEETVKEVRKRRNADPDAVIDEFEIEEDDILEKRLLDICNNSSKAVIIDVACCNDEAASLIVNNRPYKSLAQVRKVDFPVAEPKVVRGRGGRRPRKAAGDKAVDAALETLTGYSAVDALIHRCEALGKTISDIIKDWGINVSNVDGELEILEAAADSPSSTSTSTRGNYFAEQPKLLADDVKLKSYQQVGINWLSTLFEKKVSCILADEMGLGKTCQVIAFISHLKEIGVEGPHLIVVPSSTLANWLRECHRFSPSLAVELYYGTQSERGEIRDMLRDPETHFDVILTTYNLACGSYADSSFLQKFRFSTCVFDEGHMLKNSESERYRSLMRLNSDFRLLLTGTPLQNNLEELISLLAFIRPGVFRRPNFREALSVLFKHRARTTTNADDASNLALLSAQRIARAKSMMTPFVLRRRKDQVLKYLPSKRHRIEYCSMTSVQDELYKSEINESRRIIEAREAGTKMSRSEKSATNVLMRLRKAAIHPLLFRRIYTTEKLKKMAKAIMKEERYREANQQYIFEDMEVMSDFELHNLCGKFPSIANFALQNDEWMISGKVEKLKGMLIEMVKRGDRILIFSQFTQVLDILESVLKTLELEFLRLDGQTPVEMRQDLIDQFDTEKNLSCFLLSTKAGGFGINLACANVVIIFDMSFNPHDDRQAEDRAHRVGQTKEVEVVRLVTKDTIEEAILQLANTKLKLDQSVSNQASGESDKVEELNAEEVEKMLFKSK
ncbi:SNF2 family N-terminal domain-containing protein [Lipomyces oligophaga]|uniref:SNF2 family N-terminal domain-containing protein n=1 Tax=Lipomyces oligophaga TaxID=45792 RepID=UPI0034CDA2C2